MIRIFKKNKSYNWQSNLLILLFLLIKFCYSFSNENCESSSNCNNVTSCYFGACSQICSKNENSISCSCEGGYYLLKDNFTCKSVSLNHPLLVYAASFEIRLVNLEKMSPIPRTAVVPHHMASSVSLLSNVRNTVALDYYYEDPNNITIFWVDIKRSSINSGRLKKGLLVDVKPIITFGIHTPEGIVVDWIVKNIYWVDSKLDQIFVSDFNGKYVTTILSVNITNPRGIAVDPSLGYLFWSDWDIKNPRIERSNMDGSDRKVIYKSNVSSEDGWINSISLDYIAKRVYWVDAKSDKILSTDYDGNDMKEIFNDSMFIEHPFGVEVFENHVYWGDWKTFSIYRASKWNGSHIEVVDIRPFGIPLGIRIIHPSRQNKIMKNPCKDNGGCSHICLIKTKNSRTCGCPHMMVIDESGINCKMANLSILMVKGDDLYMYDLEYNTSIRYPFLNLYDEKIIDFTIDTIRNITYWIGSKSNNIQGVNYVQSHPTSKIIGGLRDFKYNEKYLSLNVDIVTGLIYYITKTLNYISFNVINPVNGFDKLLFNNNMYNFIKNPEKLIVAYKKGFILWFDTGYDNFKIFKASLDGGNIEEIKIMDNNRGKIISSASIDPNNDYIIYSNDTTESYVIILKDGSLKKINFNNYNYGKISSVSFLESKNSFLCYNINEKKLVMMRMNNNFIVTNIDQIIEIENDSLENHNLVRIIDKTPNDIVNEKDINCEKLNCSQICIRINNNLSDRKCLCGDGFMVEENKCYLKNDTFIGINNNSQVVLVNGKNSSDMDVVIKLPGEAHHLIPTSISFDLKQSILYFIDNKTLSLWMFDLYNNSATKLLVNSPHAQMKAVAANPINGLIYISSILHDEEEKYNIVEYLDPKRIDLRNVILKIKNDTIYDLFIDYKNGILIIITLNMTKYKFYVWTSDLDGSNLKFLYGGYKFKTPPKNIFFLTTKSSIIGLNDNNKWESFDYKTLKVYRDEKFTDLTLQKHLISRIKKGDFIDIDYASVPVTNKWIKINKCEENNGGCEEICFHKNYNKIFCACVFSKLDQHNKTCETYPAYLAYSLGIQIDFAPIFGDIETFRLSNEAFLEAGSMKKALKTIEATDSINNAYTLTVDMDEKQYIIADNGAHRIAAVTFDGMDNYIISEYIGPVEGVAFDPIERNIYFTSRNTIQKVSFLSTNITHYPVESEIILKLGKRDKLRGIAIDGCRKIIFYCNYREDLPSIEKVTFSGYKREKIIKNNILSPTFMAIDYKSTKLYWVDGQLNKIERIDYDGKHRENILLSDDEIKNEKDEKKEDKGIHPFGIAVYGDYIYVTDWKQRSVIMIDKITGGRSHIIAKNFYLQPFGLTVVAKEINDCGIDACTINNNLGCQDVCRLTASGIPHCSCNGERVLLPDNKTCTDDYFNKCSKDQFTCSSTLTCIPYINVCDGIKDCQNGEDEVVEFCTERVCRDGYYSCGNGRCVDDPSQCDKIFQCEGNFFNGNDCKCDPGYIFDQKERLCALIRIDYRRKEKCGNITCLNGGICDKKKNICLCPGGISGKSCENDPCYNRCLNKGICTMSTKGSPSPHCDCPIEYHGERCEKLKCAGRCNKNGICIVDEITGLPLCHCNIGWSGENCEISESVCKDFCFNNGHCLEAHNNLPYCNCPRNYNGLQCENCITKDNLPLECKNGGHCVDRSYCKCTNGFNGLNCEVNICQFHCFNDGKCSTDENGKPLCECLPSYYGDRCENSICDSEIDPCNGNGLCLPIPNIISKKNYTCLCNSRYEGENCSKKIGVHEYCINSINILPILDNPDEVECECLPGYTGSRCEIPELCINYCKNNGKCNYDYETGKRICKCVKGTAGPQCEIITAKNCSDIECKNGGVCGLSFNKNVECYCQLGWNGFDCTLPSCHDYCQNKGECHIFDNGFESTPYCKCKNGWFGVHCTSNLALNPENKNKGSFNFDEDNEIKFNKWLYLFTYFLFGIFIIGILLILFSYFYKKISITKLFNHHRLHNPLNIGCEMEEFNNEAFMLGEEAVEIPSEDDRINYSNTINGNVYNNTVFIMSDLDMRLSRQNMTSKPEAEELLHQNMEQNTNDEKIFK
ncbi:Low-density lipoprotein receptor-related protein 6 [Strongyloides ratti]|uniref:Low-density lipoprotein receptor-related protein 6 n=1 Tax=Strongyloides ratti TaxID=34506 RepID=A0A090L474_STRRB|nr:Low-density lipoprotein receptor-related protein 6 [Strongyloides ratti]CEF64522.1 Low-density lipoprotein receptor-related protein 6 [Strongyloides ratti]